MTTPQIRQAFIDFYKKRRHQEIPSVSLVPEGDPTTLFTGSGMQPLAPFLLGESHPMGKRLVNSQKCFRAQDIDQVGDDRHSTFFEMLGNWSLGDYFKKEQLPWFFSFLSDTLGLEPERLYVSVFKGGKGVPRDEESVSIWQEIFKSVGMLAKVGERIFAYGFDKNWWSRTGEPEKMPPGEPGGPDSEVFFDFGEWRKIHEKSAYRDRRCHPNCDCGRFLEVGNSVFMQYVKKQDGSLRELSKKNVDFGGGLERLVVATEDQPDIFQIDSFLPIITTIEKITGKSYQKSEYQPMMRLMADHLKAATFLMLDGVRPANKEQGYVLRRLLRRSLVKMYSLTGKLAKTSSFVAICHQVVKIYQDSPYLKDLTYSKKLVEKVIDQEITQFSNVLKSGLVRIEKEKPEKIDAKFVFDLYQSYGFPFELTEEILRQKKITVSYLAFKKELQRHKLISRKGAKKKFAGGLADHAVETVKLHTATHLLHQALRDLLGNHVGQKGSHITSERLRFDFSHPKSMTGEEIKKVEQLVNQKIKEDLAVSFKVMSLEEALKQGALAFFGTRYGEKVKVYYIGDYSKEVCGGPHVSSTKSLAGFKIVKEESVATGVRRIYAVLV